MAQLGISFFTIASQTNDLAALGTDDFFLYPVDTTQVHKAGTQKLIVTLIAGTAAPFTTTYTTNPSTLTWSGGTPTASGTTTKSIGAARSAVDKGWTITAPAGTGVRTLKLFLAAYLATTKITASLSDSSAANISNSTFVTNDINGSTQGVTITYAAASDGQTLTISLSNATGANGSEIALQGAALSTPVSGEAGGGGGSVTAAAAWVEGAETIALGGTAVGNGTGAFSTPILRNNTGTILANETGVVVNVYNATTGALVVRKTGLTSNASGVVTVSDAAIVAGTSYAYEVVLSANGRRLPLATAA